jgi:hypothetical protein
MGEGSATTASGLRSPGRASSSGEHVAYWSLLHPDKGRFVAVAAAAVFHVSARHLAERFIAERGTRLITGISGSRIEDVRPPLMAAPPLPTFAVVTVRNMPKA